jgi:uncharacterized protein YjiS (DUF1127 family)
MNALSLDFTAHRDRGLYRSDVKRLITGWWQNYRSRSELESFSDRCLQDIGISRCTAEFEAAKPFWMP